MGPLSHLLAGALSDLGTQVPELPLGKRMRPCCDAITPQIPLETLISVTRLM